MVFRKYKPAKQWGKMDTRIFKQILNAKNQRKMPSFVVPEAVKTLGVTVHDPNAPGFFTGDVIRNEQSKFAHPAFRPPPIEEHPLYNNLRCYLFDGSEPMSDGMAQACVLSRAILRQGLPESIIHSHNHLDITEQHVRDAILHGEKYDPTLEKLPRRFDPVLFWVKHPRIHGTPVIKRNNTILSNLYRTIFLTGLHSGKVNAPLRCDRDEPISGYINSTEEFKNAPFVLRFQPHITIQGEQPLTPWATPTEVEAFSSEQLIDIHPISPLIDLGSDHIYNKDSVIARPLSKLFLHTIMWTREQDQKYPWTTEQNAANAILHTFGAAVAQATRYSSRDLTKNPVVTKGVQLVNGKLDLVAFQLNTLDLSSKNPIKNVVWVEKALPLYKALPYYETLTEVHDLNMETVHKFVALLLHRLMSGVLELQKHVKYIVRNWNCFNEFYVGLEANRHTLLYFVLSSADILNELNNIFKPEQVREIIDWIYSLQFFSLFLLYLMYCEPEIPDFGATSYGWGGFGGVLFSHDGKLIPQYNLEAAWKRRLAPVAGIDQILLFDTQTESVYRHRTPGHYRYDVEPNVLKNRNLICASSTEANTFHLSVVQEHSDRRTVETYDIETHGSSRTFPNCWLNCNQTPLYLTKFDEQIAELRAACDETTWNFFARGRTKLYAINKDNKSFDIFQGSLLSWEQNPLIPEEIALLGTNNMLWNGKIGEPLGRIKMMEGDPLRAITYTDHPRVLSVADHLNIRTLDLRCDSVTNYNLLFCSPGFSEELYRHNLYKSDETLDTPTWTHIKTLPMNPYNLLAVSNYSAFLLDERLPGKAIIQNNHCIPNGPQLISAGHPVCDQSGGGLMQCFYLLDNFSTGLWKMEMYKHANEDWSSIRPLHGVPDPNDKKFIARKAKKEHRQYVYPPTRGISVVTKNVGWPGRPAEILFRYLDDGSVIYKIYYYGLNPRQEKHLSVVSLERNDHDIVEQAERSYEKMVNMFGENCMKPKEINCELVNVEVDRPSQRCTLKGFRGSHVLSSKDGQPPPNQGDGAQLAQTYSALCSLIILGDDLSRVDRKGILETVKASQHEDGSFWSQGYGSERDMRYVFCAVAVSHILGNVEIIDWNKLKSYIRHALRFDGGIGQGDGAESHGGSTYCAIAALALGRRLWNYSVLSEKEIRKLIKWALWKQNEGFHGRAHKEDDSCYAFWIGATLKILNAFEYVDHERLRTFIYKVQHPKIGGFCKTLDAQYSDFLHTYFSIAALSLLREPILLSMNPSLNVTQKTYDHLLKCQTKFDHVI